MAEKVSSALLWQNVGYGMSIEEVMRLQPDSEQNLQPEKLDDGATSDVTIPVYILHNKIYRVEFYFRDGLLKQVIVSNDKDADESDFIELRSLLLMKYGREYLKKEPDRDAFLIISESNWLTDDGVNIVLIYIEGVCLNVVYQKRIIGEMSKL